MPRIVDSLVARLDVETDGDALSPVIVALGRQDPRAAGPINAFADHENAEVRFAGPSASRSMEPSTSRC